MKKLGFILLCFFTLWGVVWGGIKTAEAADVGQGKKIIFIPLDNRPITDSETGDVGRKLGYDILVPPDELLGTREHSGNPEGLWQWLNENAFQAKAVVVSADTMIYGSLVDSRKHELTQQEIRERTARFEELHQKYPRLPIYGYSTVLRTLLSATHSGAGMEPEVYQQNAVKIYQYSVLHDKQDMNVATSKEQKELQQLQKEIARPVMDDWEKRHLLNYRANQALMELAQKDVFAYLYLGGDDSAPFSQTHFEMRHLRKYGESLALGKTRFQVTSGADELGMVMLCRAILADLKDIPFVYTAFNEGMGRDTVPKYCTDKIGEDVDGIIVAAGGMKIPAPERADLVLAVNTNPNGKTYEANAANNTFEPRSGTKYFTEMIENFIQKDYPVAVGDIAFANGADNALLEQFRQKNLQFSLQAYGGWNTATNTLGFVLGTGVLAKWLDTAAKNELLLVRYLDEWGYQANVRQQLSNVIASQPGYNQQTGSLDGSRKFAAEQGAAWLKAFADQRLILPAGMSLTNLRLEHPWNRLFECRIFF